MRKRYGILLIILLALLAICTYISGQLYRKNLPEVTAEWPVATTLRYQWDLKGSLHFTETSVYELPIAVEVVQVLAEPGMWVTEEHALLQLDQEQLYLEWLKARDSVEALEKQLGSGKAAEIRTQVYGPESRSDAPAISETAGSETSETEGRQVDYIKKLQEEQNDYTEYLTAYQYRDILKVLTQIEQLLADSGFVYAKEEGIVLSAAGKGSKGAGTVLMTLGSDAGKKEITFGLDSKQASYCKSGTTLKVFLTQHATEENTAKQSGSQSAVQDTYERETTLTVQRIFYNAAAQQYQCVVSTDAPLHMMEGEPVQAQLTATSISYNTVIPTEAIISSDNGNATFFVLREKSGILGEEPCAMVESGYILEQNETYTALSASVMNKVITSWNKPLSRECTVKVKQ